MTIETNGILAYGSLLENPGPEIEEATVEVIRNVLTPFMVEFARKSTKRSNAPILRQAGASDLQDALAKVRAEITVPAKAS